MTCSPNSTADYGHSPVDYDRIYLTFNYPGAVPGSKTLLTGIRGKGEILYITGFYEPSEDPAQRTVSFLYKGDITGRPGPCSNNKWYLLNYPSTFGQTVKATNLYGPEIFDADNVRVVGNYTTEEGGNHTFGCMYEGSLNGSGTWITLTPTEDTINTIAHSTMGDLVVGNYDTTSVLGKAFIYDVNARKYYNVTKPKAKSITAYGIWHNGGSHYTICGGFSNLDVSLGIGSAYLVDWNNCTHKLSNWREYQYQNTNNKSAIVTHFNGITSDRHGGYNLTGDAVIPKVGAIAFFVNANGKQMQEDQIKFPSSTVTSGNSVYKRTVIGVYTNEPDSTVNGYISVVI